MKTNRKSPPVWGKLTKMCCLAVAAFLGLTMSARAQDECSGAITLTVGDANCVYGNNFTATANVFDPPNCNDGCEWLESSATPVNYTVWYTFTVNTRGVYTINTDNNSHGDDTQLKLLKRGATDCSFDNAFGIRCNDDGGWENILAAVITDTLDSGTYYVVVDIFGSAGVRGEWCINVYENKVASNDCVFNSIAVNSLATAAGTCPWFGSNAYFYNAPWSNSSCYVEENSAPGLDEVMQCGSVIEKCNNPALNEPQHRGVWFTFVYNSSNPVWASVYPNNGGEYYNLTAYKKDGTITVNGGTTCASGTNTISGLCYLACSTGDDGTRTSADDADRARCNNYKVPKIDFKTLQTNGNISDGDTIYLRVSEYATALITISADSSDTLISLADGDPGIFNLVFEAAPNGNVGADGRSMDRCDDDVTVGCSDDGLFNYNKFYPCMSNAGMQGNYYAGAFPLPGGSCPARTDEPSQFNYSGTSGLKDCTDPAIYSSGKTLYNSALYNFTVTDGTSDAQVRRSLCQRLLTVIGLLPASINPLADPQYLVIKGQLTTLANTLCSVIDTVGCATLTTLINQLDAIPAIPDNIIAQLNELRDLFCNLAVSASCRAYVTVQFENIQSAGMNWEGINAEVIRADGCGGSAIGLMGGFSYEADGIPGKDDGCLTLQSTAFLPAGKYTIVVDGETGQIATYDLRIIVQYKDTVTGLLCGNECGTFYRKGASAPVVSRFGFDFVRPNPARDNIELGFTSDVTGQVTMRIIDLTGKVRETVIDASIGSNLKAMNVSDLPAGVYIISLENGSSIVRTKFVKVD
jgi:hypothetical protein